MVIALLPACIFSQSEEWVLYMIGNAHIDLAYRWRWNETTDRVTPDTFIGVLDMLDKMPELTYAQSQMALYESIEKTHPQVFRRIREKISAGQWSVVGGQWAEPDAILPSGESHIRQFLIGAEYCRTHLGVDSVDIGWLPDAFCGQALTLPQIFSGCGIRYYLFGRGAPAGKQVFRWVAPDSSSLLAYHLPVPYGLTAPDADLLTPLRDWRRTTGLPFAMVLFGEGDHGGGPRQTDIEAIERLRKMDGVPTLRYATAEDFFARLAKAPTAWPDHFGEIGRGILDKFQSRGIIGVAFWENGWRNLSTSKRKVLKPEDLKGLKIRTMENKVHMASFTAAGASPVPMVWGEVYTSLQQGVIDGQENPVVIIHSNALWEVQKYYALTGHFYGSHVFLASKRNLDKLPKDIQKIILDTARELSAFQRDYSKKLEDELIVQLKAKGMDVYEIPNKKAFQDAMQPVYKQFESQFGKDLIKAILETK